MSNELMITGSECFHNGISGNCGPDCPVYMTDECSASVDVEQVLDDAADLGMKMIAMAFGIPASTAAVAQPTGQEIMSQIKEMYDLLNQPLYYATSEYVERGKVLYSAGTLATPESIVVHPDDLEKVSIPGRRLVHLRDYKPTLGEVIVLLEDMAADEA